MKKYLLTCMNNIAAAFAVALCGKEALETHSILWCTLLWIGVYAALELHVYFTNYIKDLN